MAPPATRPLATRWTISRHNRRHRHHLRRRSGWQTNGPSIIQAADATGCELMDLGQPERMGSLDLDREGQRAGPPAQLADHRINAAQDAPAAIGGIAGCDPPQFIGSGPALGDAEDGM
jgi:hypothetical protein